jgi:hypothetical protein
LRWFALATIISLDVFEFFVRLRYDAHFFRTDRARHLASCDLQRQAREDIEACDPGVRLIITISAALKCDAMLATRGCAGED